MDTLTVPGMLLSKLLMVATNRRAFCLLAPVVMRTLRELGADFDAAQFNYLSLFEEVTPSPKLIFQSKLLVKCAGASFTICRGSTSGRPCSPLLHH